MLPILNLTPDAAASPTDYFDCQHCRSADALCLQIPDALPKTLEKMPETQQADTSALLRAVLLPPLAILRMRAAVLLSGI